jgi:integrase
MAEKMRLSDAIDAYVEHMRAKGREPRTIKNHRQPLTRALVLWGNIYVESITPNHIDRLFADAGWGPSTQNLYLSTLRGGFFAWCRRNRVLHRDYDPTEGWTNVKVPNTPKLWIEVEEFADLLEACDNGRDRMVCALGLFTFCRGSEISGLRIADLDFDHNTVNVYREKTKEWDLLPMSLELRGELLRWLATYEREVGEPVQSHWFLVPARSALPMTYDPAVGKLQPTGEPARLKPEVRLGKPYDCVKRPLARIGYTGKGYGAHTLRRSGARSWYEALRESGHDAAMRRVQALLGHKSLVMTERYLNIQLERKERNILIAGKAMFPGMKTATIRRLEVS